MTEILVCTPTHDLRCGMNYASSIANLEKFYAHHPRRVKTSYFLPALAMVTEARNVAASLVLHNRAFSHLLFIDSDMGFRPEAVERLFDFAVEVAGCAYPKRALDPARLMATARVAGSPREAWEAALDYVELSGLVTADGGVEVRHGFVRTRVLGMGLTLIARSAIEALAERLPGLITPADAAHRAMGAPDTVFQVFQPLADEAGRFMSEDVSFCRRWTDGGGELWACIDETLSHLGPMQFIGAPHVRLRSRA